MRLAATSRLVPTLTAIASCLGLLLSACGGELGNRSTQLSEPAATDTPYPPTATLTPTPPPSLTPTPTSSTTPTPLPSLTTTPSPTVTATLSACSQGCSEHLPGCDIKGNISQTTGEKIFHVPGNEFYEQTVINPDYGERWFCTEEEAIANGWRKTKR